MSIHKVIKGSDLVATVATLEAVMFKSITNAVISAVYELLFRERQELPSFCKMGTLDGTDGGKGPA